MASIPFTLAALATSAVPDLEVLGVSSDEQGEAFRSAVITNGTAEFLVRVPRTELAEVRQSAELLGLAALSEGSRAVLPFEVPETLGMTRAGDTRAVVTTYIGGDQFEVDHLQEDSLLLQPIAEMLAAIHGLPLSIAQQGGLPVRSAQDLRLQATRVIDRAEATRLLPQTVLDRWKHVVETSELWDFAPAMVHGSLDADHLRISSEQITGVVGWSELSVGDPATDMAWLMNAGSEVLDGVLARYAKLHNSSSLPHVRARAALYAELEIARWLFHGIDTHDETIVNDAVGMLDRLVDSIGVFGERLGPAQHQTPLSEDEVSALLDETPEVNDVLSDTAAYEALDEDRMFGMDTDFIEPLQEQPASESEPPADSDEQLTEPIDEDDLPESSGSTPR
ncbi:phosphotransferase [Leucobacter viscericola]|uniref:Phosphotransferase n=1 Tax=Leucobacter viscericola TaxID=2714935 RepID=A0A6G7XD08_9MICO|nr:phosphotransferase [Leucobacter viscericola]QIK62258.1 phosphotransferase [Leucobacter viscericola]